MGVAVPYILTIGDISCRIFVTCRHVVQSLKMLVIFSVCPRKNRKVLAASCLQVFIVQTTENTEMRLIRSGIFQPLSLASGFNA